MRPLPLALIVVLLLVLVIVPGLAMASGHCAGMADRCEGPCGSGSYVTTFPASGVGPELAADPVLVPANRVSAAPLTVLELPPK